MSLGRIGDGALMKSSDVKEEAFMKSSDVWGGWKFAFSGEGAFESLIYM